MHSSGVFYILRFIGSYFLIIIRYFCRMDDICFEVQRKFNIYDTCPSPTSTQIELCSYFSSYHALYQPLLFSSEINNFSKFFKLQPSFFWLNQFSFFLSPFVNMLESISIICCIVLFLTLFNIKQPNAFFCPVRDRRSQHQLDYFSAEKICSKIFPKH